MFANSNFRACVAGSAKRGSTQARVAESPKPHNHTNYNSRSESSTSKLQTTTVDKKGRVKIPKILLENLGLEAPATLAIGIEGGAIVMTLHPTPGEPASRRLKQFVEKETISDRIAELVDGASGQDPKHRGSKDELRDMMELLGMDDVDVPETIEGLIKDCAKEGENLDIVRSARNRI